MVSARVPTVPHAAATPPTRRTITLREQSLESAMTGDVYTGSHAQSKAKWSGPILRCVAVGPDPSSRICYFGFVGASNRSALQAIAGLEHPPHRQQQDEQEAEGHREADADGDVGGAVEAPAKTADQIDHRVEERDL